MSVETAAVESLDYRLSPLPVRGGLCRGPEARLGAAGGAGGVVVRGRPGRHRRGDARGGGLRLLPGTQGGAVAICRDRRA